MTTSHQHWHCSNIEVLQMWEGHKRDKVNIWNHTICRCNRCIHIPPVNFTHAFGSMWQVNKWGGGTITDEKGHLFSMQSRNTCKSTYLFKSFEVFTQKTERAFRSADTELHDALLQNLLDVMFLDVCFHFAQTVFLVGVGGHLELVTCSTTCGFREHQVFVTRNLIGRCSHLPYLSSNGDLDNNRIYLSAINIVLINIYCSLNHYTIKFELLNFSKLFNT